MSRRPVIGVTGPVKGGLFAWIMTWFALKRAGARPVRITAETVTDSICLDGLVLGGGSDIDPENYGEELLRIKDPEPEQPCQRPGVKPGFLFYCVWCSA